MGTTLQDIKNEADRRLAAGQKLEALKVYRLVLEGAPLDFDLRLQIADLLVKMNADAFGAAVYKAIVEHDIKSGNPLWGIVALKLLEIMSVDTGPFVEALTDKYAVGSMVLGKGLRPAPADYTAAVRDDIDLNYDMDPKDLTKTTAQMAAYLENIKNYPGVVPPVPIYSTLEKDAFTSLLSKLRLKRFNQGDAIITQGEIGEAVYFLARGEVSVMRSSDDDTDPEKSTRLARLGPGSLFGEMALVSFEPRSASVICDTPTDVLELTKDHVDLVAAQIPQVGAAMARFTQERVINNLIATHPIFKPFDEEASKDLLGRFTGHEVPKGTIFLEQGTPGNGLYILLNGRAEVLRWDEAEYIKVADLGPGDVAGEISLLFEEPVSATVRTTTQATLLFLARELFKTLVDAVPELLAHFNRLAERRLADTEEKVRMSKILEQDFIEELATEQELDEDDLVFI